MGKSVKSTRAKSTRAKSTRKKNIDECTAQRSKRFRLCIAMLDKPIDKLKARPGVSSSLLKKWHHAARHITERNIDKAINMLRQEGLYCTPKWLLHGKGVPPFLLKGDENSIDDISPNLSIVKEIEAFKTNNKNSVIVGCEDDAMYPFLSQGDYAGGIIVKEEDYKSISGEICIVELKDGRKFVRRFYVDDTILLVAIKKDEFPSLMTDLTLIERVSLVVFTRRIMKLFEKRSQGSVSAEEKEAH